MTNEVARPEKMGHGGNGIVKFTRLENIELQKLKVRNHSLNNLVGVSQVVSNNFWFDLPTVTHIYSYLPFHAVDLTLG